MRSWHPITPSALDNKRLLGEHCELHCMGSVIANNRKGYSRHPETMRWRGHTKALKARHDAIAKEMARRGFKHASPFPWVINGDTEAFPGLIEPLRSMKQKLKDKQKGFNKQEKS